jgi:AraC-like DNA-binding protein
MVETERLEFLREPVGRYVRGPSFLVWCSSPTLCGALYWGTQNEADVRALRELYEIDRHPRMERPLDVLTDGRHVSGLDPLAFGLLEDYLRRRVGQFARSIRRHAIVRPGGQGPGGYVGASMEGLYPMVGVKHESRVFVGVAEALTWLGAGALGPTLTQLTTGAVPGIVARLRALLAREPQGVSRERAARMLGVSQRSLQRALRAAGSTVRDELARARVERACALLETEDEKLDAVAERAGFGSRSRMFAAFHRVLGESPAVFRSRRRRSRGR